MEKDGFVLKVLNKYSDYLKELWNYKKGHIYNINYFNDYNKARTTLIDTTL